MDITPYLPFHSMKALCHESASLGRCLVWSRPVDGGAVGEDAIMHAATEQLIDGDTKRLALQVPQGDVNTAENSHPHAARPKYPQNNAVVDTLPQPFDVRGVLANQHGRKN